MQYKALISDLDGTLVAKNEKLSKRVYDTLKTFVANGYYFSIASGRGYHAIETICHQLHLTTPQITRGGSEIVDPRTGNVIYADYINSKTLQNLIDTCNDNNIPFYIEKGDAAYAQIPLKRYEHRDFRDISELDLIDVPKVCLLADYLDDAEVAAFVEEKITKVFPDLHSIRSQGPTWNVWDITSIKATKQHAVITVAKMLGIDTSQIVGIGDGYNDYPLLMACGYKVAMNTAPEELKAIADYIAPSQKEDGVAVMIERVFKKS